MLPKNYRLKKSSAFKATYHTKNSVSDELFIIFAGKIKNHNSPTKTGFVVSKKNHKRAVKRNRLKRLMRESIRLEIKKNSLALADKFTSLVIVARDKAIGKDFKTVQQSLSNLLYRLKTK